MRGALLAAGTSSDAGKSVLVAGLCRWLARTGRDFTPAPDVSFAAVRQRRFDVLADMVGEHLGTAALGDLIAGGVPASLPTVISSLAH